MQIVDFGGSEETGCGDESCARVSFSILQVIPPRVP